MRRQGEGRAEVCRQAFALIDRRLRSVSFNLLKNVQHLLFFLLDPAVVFLYRVLHYLNLTGKIVSLLTLLQNAMLISIEALFIQSLIKSIDCFMRLSLCSLHLLILSLF